MIVHAILSAPRPFRSRSPATKMPTDQLVKIRFAKKAASARPSAHRLNPKKKMARIETGIMPIDSRTMLMTIRSEEHTSELQSLRHIVCRLLLEKKQEKK